MYALACFVAGTASGLLIAWYLTKKHYKSKYVPKNDHIDLLSKYENLTEEINVIKRKNNAPV